jgi:hypothetical protein
MPETRSGRKTDSAVADATSQGTKRKADGVKPPATAKKDPELKKQKTLEEVTPQNGDKNDDAKAESGAVQPPEGGSEHTTTEERPKEEENEANGGEKQSTSNGNAVEEHSGREDKVPSSILEKGVIYFFTRPRVGIEEPESVGDLSRTYFVLRPLPHGAKLGEGSLPDEKVSRLFALPKKTLPKSHSDRFMAFVEKAKTSVSELKDSFLKGETYETKTSGTRTTEPVHPVGEGVYAITRDEGR